MRIFENEANLALMQTKSSESDSDFENGDDIFSELTHEELIFSCSLIHI